MMIRIPCEEYENCQLKQEEKMSKYVFGVDVGGTTVKLGLFDIEGNLQDKWEIKTRTENKGENIVPDIAESISKKMKEKNISKADLAGVGMGVPGPVTTNGHVVKAVNLGWEDYNPNDALGKLLAVPVKTGNDANVAALGEMWRGGGQGYTNLVAVTLGTGVGGGIIVDGHIVSGANGAGGEIGHIHLEDNEVDVCGCGRCGCLEQYASATGIVRIAKKKLESSEQDSILRKDHINAKMVWDAVKEGDALAIEVAHVYGEYLGKGLAVVSGVVDPEIFVIGGGVSKAGEVLIDYLKPYYEKYVLHACKDAKFALATLGNDAGIYGSARLVLE